MVLLSVSRLANALCVVFSLALLFGCRQHPKTTETMPENPTLPRREDIVGTSPPMSLQVVPKLEPSTHLMKPHEDALASIERVRARLKRELESRSPEMKDIGKLHALWGETWTPSFDEPLESTSLREVASGQNVPPEVIAHINENASMAELLAKGQVNFMSDQKEFETVYALSLLASSVCTGSGAELPAFLHRAGSLPPNKGDIVVFRALNDGLMFLEHPVVLNDAQFNGWCQLAIAKNPVYRLITARTFHLVSSDVEQVSEVYLRLLKDSDPVIARIAVIASSRYVTDKTSTALTEFQERQNRIGNTELAEVAAKALLRIEKHP